MENVIGERLKQLCKEEGSVESFAYKIGASKSTVYTWIHGTNQMKVHTLLKITQVYGVSADWVMGTSDTRKQAKIYEARMKATQIEFNDFVAAVRRDIDKLAFLYANAMFKKGR